MQRTLGSISSSQISEAFASASVTLRASLPSDLPIFFDQQQDPGANHMAAFTWRDPADRAAFDEHWRRVLNDPSVTNRTILLDEVVAGYIASFILDGHREVCYWLGRTFWGRGVATAALTHFLAVEPTRPLHACVAHDNIASRRVLENCGFVACGTGRTFAEARQAEIEELYLVLGE